jgi:hypothetical protein
MGREVRRVPADWQHPKKQMFDHRGQWVERYEALHGGNWAEDAKRWDDAREKWERGEFPDYASEENKALPFDQWDSQRPYSGDYMPQWPESERTHLMMYETTSEGTPISPAFATPEELARWLADNDASAFGGMTASYESWLRVASGGFAPSAIYTPETGLVSGVEAPASTTDAGVAG